MTRILVVDNYDSFVFNLVQYLGQLGADVVVRRNDEVSTAEAEDFDGVLLSPGPGTPEDAGISVEMVGKCEDRGVPLLGVCLGHQAIAVAPGAPVGPGPPRLARQTREGGHPGGRVVDRLTQPVTPTR
ncbi:MAG: aminodeoxychorismate/anthranilate synthase component II, partial [Frankiaceae bacterium]|nr:aminodeoxychorismate/anthranilate synthase component II [Frankiaceae bacterium]